MSLESICDEFIESHPHSLVYLHNRLLFLSSYLFKDERISWLVFLKDLWMRQASSTPENFRIAIIKSTANYIKGQLSPKPHSVIDDVPFRLIQNDLDFYVTRMISVPYCHLSNEPENGKSMKETNEIEETFDVTGRQPKLTDPEILINLLSLFNYLGFQAWEEIRWNSSFPLIIISLASKLISSEFWEKIKDDPNTRHICRYKLENQNQSIPSSDYTAEKKKICHQLRDLKRYLAENAQSESDPNEEPLTFHETTFMKIFWKIYRQINVNQSFGHYLQNSLDEPNWKNTRKGHDQIPVIFEADDTIHRSNSWIDYFTELIVHQGLQLELYKSIKRLVTIFLSKDRLIKSEVVSDSVNLFFKVLPCLTRSERLHLRNQIFNDRSFELEITTPIFNTWEIWPFDFDKRIISVCNKILSPTLTLDRSFEDKGGHDYDERFLHKKATNTQLDVVDSLIELSFISPYHVLEELIKQTILNKGQGPLILDILCQLGNLCWLQPKSGSSRLLIIVLEDILEKIDDGLIQLTEQEAKNWVEFVTHGMLGDSGKININIEDLEIDDLSGKILDFREYVNQCLIPFLERYQKSGNTHTTFSLSIATLQNLLQSFLSKPSVPEAFWLLLVKPYQLLHFLGLCLDQRQSGALSSMKQIDDIYVLMKDIIEILGQLMKEISLDSMEYSILQRNADNAHRLYKDSKDLDWMTQLLLRPFFEMCCAVFGFELDQLALPAALISFCEISTDYLSIDEEKMEGNQAIIVQQMKKMMLFLDGCRVSDDWLNYFCSALNKAKNITRSNLRDLFMKIGPFAFCATLSSSIGEEARRLLNNFLKKLFSYGMLSTTELLMIFNENQSELNFLVIESLDMSASLRFSTIKILSCLRKLSYLKESASNSPLQEQGINDIWIVQNIGKNIKILVPSSASLNYLVLAFVSIVTGLEMLDDALPNSREILYICLLSIVEILGERMQQKRRQKSGEKDIKESPDNICHQQWRDNLLFDAVGRIKEEGGRSAVIGAWNPE
ncbi:hypothetical protein G9A89_014229 [Geosiphon pyriformis]|nr:hypothetical protein G9A89_014229 [Geosiphon pyriformis]